MKSKLHFKVTGYIAIVLVILGVWIVLVILPLVDLLVGKTDNQVLKKITQIIAVLMVAVIPFGIIILKLVDRYIMGPVRQITAATRVLATGNLGVRLQLKTNDELLELSENINKIIDNLLLSLKSMIMALQKNREKETELTHNLSELERSRRQTQLALDQLQLEKARLQQTNSKDEAILTSIGDGVVAISQDNRIFLFNRMAARLSGFTKDEVIGQPYREVVKFATEKEGDEINIVDQVYQGSQGLSEGRLVIINRNGQRTPISLTAAPIRNELNLIQGVVIVFRDVTHDRQLDKMKDEFVSIASHELRTPMTAIKGMLSMILEGDYGQYGQELKEPLEDISLSTNRLIALVNDILDVSRIEAGRIKIKLTTFKIDDVINEVVGSLKIVAAQKGLELKIGALSIYSVQADIDKTKQILNNLIGNSIKFTDQGSITISAEIAQEFIKVYVVDTGIGIRVEDRPKLFGKFAQIVTAQTGKPVGTGLGLFISKQLCQMMGGDLWIAGSQVGRGSTFVFSLPVAGTSLAKKIQEKVAK